ncbi:pseudouridylate synthase PUS7L isoform X2 [Hippocampus comes]|uniref:pseudouridylate synthase PUS7L isoform X2 n=1 Tax=Hippocampus comes TaxID=109280 RepID=UPI00094F2812|nr:PREDICTED: pseudouridylate synthase 7 homolog-like protein isoform X2 [Hippocampus comes]
MTMKQDGDAASVPACFISNHEGFLGNIKKFIRDFVVTEIDTDGRQVNTGAATLAPQSTDKSSGSRKRDQNHQGSEDGDFAADCRFDLTISSPDSLDLSMVLGQAVSEQLEQFVVSLRDEAEEGEESGHKELSLGSFTDKYQRANVHRAVRHRFPFLMTVTIQPEIRVREDPDYRELSQLVTEEEAEDFFRFIDAKVQDSSYTFHPDDNKEHRTAVHHFLNRRFGKLVETKSFNQQERTAISVRLRERGRPKKRSAEERREEDVYTAFTLCKENLETLEAISYMAATLGVLPSDFTYAGIKDKRALTYQSMVVKKVSPQRLMEKRAELEKRGMRLSHIRPAAEPLKLGRLRGNHFDLVVRDLKSHGGSAAHSGAETQRRLAGLVEEALQNVQVRGFVNYYGPQRFGTGQSVQSDLVGLALLKEDMVNAVRLFFSPEDGDDPPSQAKRHFLQTDNAKESLALMPASKARERLMLRALNRYGTGPEGCAKAWLSLPHGMRVFYPHAYCSRVWNEAVAHRLATLGHHVRTGDLVWTQQEAEQTDDGGECGAARIHVVTQAEERQGAYALAQVLLPMPGNAVRYPENAMGAWYRERLARDGLDNCRFRVGGLKLNLPGCYRPLLANLCNLSYRLQTGEEGAGGGRATGNGGGKSEGRFKATAEDAERDESLTLTLNFDLDSSCYATICLREIMKCDL